MGIQLPKLTFRYYRSSPAIGIVGMGMQWAIWSRSDTIGASDNFLISSDAGYGQSVAIDLFNRWILSRWLLHLRLLLGILI